MAETDSPSPTSPKRKRRRLRRYGVAFLVIMILWTGACMTGRVADKVLLIPQSPREHVWGATPFTLPFDGGTLEIYAAKSPGAWKRAPQAYMLEFTGNGTAAEDIAGFVAERWGDRSVEVWVMNYPGYGHSTGTARLDKLGPAGLATFDALRAKAGDKPIYLAGNSMGTTVALHVAANRPVAGIILQSPPPLRQIILRDFGWWNLWLIAGPIAWSVPASLDSLANAAKVKVPAIFITCDHDQLVKPERQQVIYDAYAGPKRHIVLKDKGHNDSLEKRDELVEFAGALDWMTSAR